MENPPGFPTQKGSMENPVGFPTDPDYYEPPRGASAAPTTAQEGGAYGATLPFFFRVIVPGSKTTTKTDLLRQI